MDIICELDVDEKCKKYPDFNKDDVEKIRNWLDKTPHLPKITNHEIFMFLHSTEFSVEASKIKIDNFYTCRTHMPQYFGCRDPTSDDVKFAHETVIHMRLPKQTPEGYCIIFMKMIEPASFNLKLYLNLSNYTSEVQMMSQADALGEGCVFLIDLTGSSLAHLAQINLYEVKKVLFYLTETFPIRLKGAHFINAPFPMLMDKILSILRPMLPGEMSNHIYVHENLESLTKYIPLECLPNDYEGGKLKSAQELTRDDYAFILKNRNYFLEEPKHRRVNEKLRPEKMKSNMDIFGLEGNFKKLDID